VLAARKLKITVIGTGYLGVTHAACMAELGFEVLGLDVDEAKVAQLSEGTVPFYEPELEPLLRKHLDSQTLRFTTSYEEAGAFGDVHFLCVGTPQRRGELAADLTYVDAVIDSLGPKISKDCLVVGKSTVPVGTAQRLEKRLAELAPSGVKAELAWNPEFLREGYAVDDTLRPDRLVVGVKSAEAEKTLRAVYKDAIAAGTPFLVADFPTAELVKVSANAFLATKISFINAMAEVCEHAGADVTVLADALGHDDRIGRKFLNAGIGFGGGCLPKDIRAFMARAGELGADQALTFLREVDAINMRARLRAVDVARECSGGSFIGKRIAVLGAAFKPNSDDIRDSPALNIAGQIQLQGGHVTVYDPKAIENARKLYPTLGYAGSVLETCAGADIVLHLTEWAEFREMDPAILDDVVNNRCIVDGRNALDADRWRAAGWSYHGLGR
jgi:UDPglucose 6-dehydrogenase